MTSRADRERTFGRRLSEGEPDALWGWDTPAGRRRAERRAGLLVATAGLRAGITALEVGCGTGRFTERFAASGVGLTAVDVSDSLLERAQDRVRNVRFILGDFADADVGGPFDAIVGSSVLHHLPVTAALARMFALLKPGGRLAFAEPNLLNPQVFLERRLRFLPYYAAYTSADETAFVRWTLARTLRAQGFTDVEITPHDWLHPSTPPAALDRVARLGSHIEHWPIVREFAGSLLIAAKRP